MVNFDTSSYNLHDLSKKTQCLSKIELFLSKKVRKTVIFLKRIDYLMNYLCDKTLWFIHLYIVISHNHTII